MAKPRKKSAKASKPAKKAAKKTSGKKLNKSEGEHPHTNVPRKDEIGVMPPSAPVAANVPVAGTPEASPGFPPEGTPPETAK